MQRGSNDGRTGEGKGPGMKLRIARLNEAIVKLREVAHALYKKSKVGRRLSDFVEGVKRRIGKTESRPADDRLKIAHYNLVLMDGDGQVVWGREFDAGGAFEFKHGQRLYVRCEFTNHSAREAQVAEYEIELTAEDGAVVGRFGDSFGDAMMVAPGESKQFLGQWSM